MKSKRDTESEKTIGDFLLGKTDITVSLFHHFTREFAKIGSVTLRSAKTMIGIATSRKRVAYITQLGKNFIHVVFPFDRPYNDNLCFQKIAQVPGEQQFNHHFRMHAKEDVNDEVRSFMRLAIKEGS